jgi:O-methyltransferase
MLGSPVAFLHTRTAKAYKDLPINDWPFWMGILHRISVPKLIPITHLRKRQPSPAGKANINIIIELLERTTSVPGDVAECGVFQGGSLIPISIWCRDHTPERTIYGFDSFQGFDEAINLDLGLGGADDGDKRLHGFAETSFERVLQKVDCFELQYIVNLVPGYFRDTLAYVETLRFAFVHLDVDIYQSYRECLAFFYPRMTPGGIILFDEYDDPPWPGCNKAVDEFLADKLERPTMIERDRDQKWFIVRAEGEDMVADRSS